MSIFILRCFCSILSFWELKRLCCYFGNLLVVLVSSVFAKGASLSPRHTFALLQRKYKLFIQSVPHPGQTPALGAWLCRAGTDGNLSLVIIRRCRASEQHWWAGKGLCLVRISVCDRASAERRSEQGRAAELCLWSSFRGSRAVGLGHTLSRAGP